MATSADRESHFPAIEKKHGKPAAYWLKLLAKEGGTKYDDQISYLRNQHGFSQAHANALVMYARGSSTTKRFATAEDYFKVLDATTQKTMRTIFSAITKKHKDLELVIAWNQPMLKYGKKYLFGASAHKNHILLAPFNAEVLAELKPKLANYTLNKKTFKVPIDWKVDASLLNEIIDLQLAHLE